MGKIIETAINHFDGGIVGDRNPAENVCRMVSNFDVLTNPNRMTPYRDSESGDNAASTSQKRNFCVALRTGTTYSLYALGVVSGQTYAEVLYKDLTSGSSNDLSDAPWTNTTNNQSSSGAKNNNLFVYYQRTGYIYGARNGSHIFRYDPAGTAAWVDTHQAITYTNISQGLVHSKDDILYIPYDNKIAKNDNGTWTVTALTLPAHYYITSICEYGNFLAIAAAPLSREGNSRVYLWDRDSSLVTISESIDWGSGTLGVLEQVDGELIGISVVTTANQISGIVATTGGHIFRDKVIFRRLVGNVAIKIKEIFGENNSTRIGIGKQRVDNRLFFIMEIKLNGSIRDGVWSIGRTPRGEFALINERTANNDTAIGSGTLYNFFIVGDYIITAYQNTGLSQAVSKTTETASYTATSLYETKTFNGGDSTLSKKLKGISVSTEPMPTTSATATIVVKYRLDTQTTFSTIMTNAMSTFTVTIASPAVFTLTSHGFTEDTAIVFSTTGALPTGLTVGTIYYVIAAGLTANAFRVSTSVGGSAVNTSGTQSGTHGVLRLPKAISGGAINIESSGANLPEYKEVSFRIESTGGAEVTELKFREEILDKRPY